MALYTLKSREEALAPYGGNWGGGQTSSGNSVKDNFNNSWNDLYNNMKKSNEYGSKNGYKSVFGTTAWDLATTSLDNATKKIFNGISDDVDFNAEAVINAYNNLSSDDKWDVYQNLQDAKNKYSQAYAKAEKDGDQYLMNLYGNGIKYADLYDQLIGGIDKGDKSLGKSIGDWITSGGFVGDMSRTATNVLGDITGDTETAQYVNNKYNTQNEGNHGLVQAANFVGNSVGNIGINAMTGGAYGLANSGAGLAHEVASAVTDADKTYYVDQNGNIARQNQTNEQKLADIGGAALNLGLNVAGAKGIGPTLNFKDGQSLQSLVANKNYGDLLKGVGKYAMKELPWAAGTSLADTAIQASGYGDSAWKNYGSNFANNVMGDVAMDITGALRQGVRQQAADNDAKTELYRQLIEEAATNPELTSDDSGAKDLTSLFEPDQDLAIKKRNKLQSVGEQLKNVGKTQKYSALYDALDPKTATRAVQTGAPEALAKLGVNPENYSEAAKTSNYVNKVVTDLADQSGVKVNITDLPQRLSADNSDVIMSDTALRKYNSIIGQIIPDGSTPDEYSAGYLLRKSRELGQKAANLRGNTDDVTTLRQALTDAKYVLRDYATNALEGSEITGDLTNDNIAKGLAKIGANQKIQDYYTEAVDGKAPTVADYIRRSAVFEQARDMGTQMEAEKYTRSASKAPTNPMTKIWNASGLDQPTNIVLKNTVSPIAGFATRVAGSAIEGAGNLGAKAGNTFSRLKTPAGRAELKADLATSLKNNYYSGKNNPQMQLYTALSNSTKDNYNKKNATQYIEEAQKEINEELKAGNGATSSNGADAASTVLYNSLYGSGTQPMAQTAQTQAQVAAAQGFNPDDYFFEPTGDELSDMLSRAMKRAKDAEDYDAFGTLYEMYGDAITQKQKNSEKDYTDPKNWSSKDRSDLLTAQNGLSQIASLEKTYNKAVGEGGGNGIQGTLRTWASDISGGNWDPSASNYIKQAQSIGAGLIKNLVNLGSTEYDAQRYIDYLPKLTDTREQADQKIQVLKKAYEDVIRNLESVYYS